MPLPEDSRQRSDASRPASRIDVCARPAQNHPHCQPTSEMVSIIQIVDTIIEPLLRQLSPTSRSMPGGRQRRDTPNPAIPQQAANSARHLLPQQGSRLAAKLGAEQDEHFMIEFNSVQNCDECEEYAQELRDFLNAIRGFKSGGGVIAFSVDTKYRQGLHLIVSEEYAATLTDRILSAFDAADIPLLLGDPEKLYGDTNAIVVVGRRAK